MLSTEQLPQFLPADHRFPASPLPFIPPLYPALCQEGMKKQLGRGTGEQGTPEVGREGRSQAQPPAAARQWRPLAARSIAPAAAALGFVLSAPGSRFLALAASFPALTARKGAELAAPRLRGPARWPRREPRSSWQGRTSSNPNPSLIFSSRFHLAIFPPSAHANPQGN